MTHTNEFTGLAEFLAVARHASFRAAGAELGVTPSAVSQAIRSLETRIGLPLFLRTTRSVSLTEAGSRLMSRLAPAAVEINEALGALDALRERPAGNLRLSVPRIAMELIIARILPEFRRLYPEVTVEIDVNDATVDLSTAQFDAGIRIEEFVERDMVAVRLTPDFRWVVVGSPAYFAARGRPRSPKDLMQHECVRYRFPSAHTIYRWQFLRRGGEYSLDAPGGIVVNDHLGMVEFARLGLGLAYTVDLLVKADIESGALEEVLAPHLPTKAGLFLYFPVRSQTQPKLRAFIDIATAYWGGRR